MYTVINFKTKKALKEAVKRRLRWLELHPTLTDENCLAVPIMSIGSVLSNKEFPDGEPEQITFWQRNNMFGTTPTQNGVETIEGPHFPEPHRWYARCTIVDGEVMKVS